MSGLKHVPQYVLGHVVCSEAADVAALRNHPVDGGALALIESPRSRT
jgi:hypothetical protein